MPDKPEGDKSTEPGKSRLETLRAYGIEPAWPEVHAQYLADFLFEIGPSMPGAMGPEPLSSQEVAAWQQSTGIVLQPWEFRLIRALSQTFVGESRAATKRNSPAPVELNHAHPDGLDAARRLEASMEESMDL